MGTNKVTLADIAQHAGVSTASVSRVINGVPPISDELRSAVESAINHLGYPTKPRTASGQASVVVLIGDLHNTYYAELASGIQSVAEQHGILVDIVVDQPSADFGSLLFRWLSRARSVGLIVCSSSAAYPKQLLQMHRLNHSSIVAINPASSVGKIPTIRIDYVRAMAKSVQHAVKFGHTRIAMINGGEGAYSSISKKQGVVTSLQAAGLPLRDELYVAGAATIEGGFQTMNTLLGLPDDRRPTAVIASNDLMALGAMHAIRSQGMSLPDDVTVIGFDDIAMAAHANPPLTTIAPPTFEMGSRAMRTLLDIQEKGPGIQDSFIVMESPLIVRESSGPCPS